MKRRKLLLRKSTSISAGAAKYIEENELNINLRLIRGSGKGGKIILKDIKNFLKDQ